MSKRAWWVLGSVVAIVAAFAAGRFRGPGSAAPLAIRAITFSGSDTQPAVAGTRMVFASERDGRSRIWAKDLVSNAEWPLTGGGDSEPRISRDGRSVLYIREGALRRSDRDGSWPAVGADFSPDGSSVVLVRQKEAGTGLWSVVVISDREKAIGEFEAKELTSPRWSPDGRRIAFRRRIQGEAGPASILLLEADGTRKSTIASAPGGYDISAVAWRGNDTLLYAQQMSEAPSGPARLVEHSLTDGGTKVRAALEHAARTVAVTDDGGVVLDSYSPRQHLREVELATGAGRWLTGGDSVDRTPVYSPDGKRIVFASDRAGSFDLWEVAGGGALRQLTAAATAEWAPAFSPDGARLYWAAGAASRPELWSGDGEARSGRRIAEDADSPAVTPDGAYVLYQNFAGFHRVRPDGADHKLVQQELCFYASVSPDGSTVACSYGTGVRFLRAADGVRLPFEIAEATRAVWLPGGRAVAFVGERGIFKQDFGGSTRAVMARFELQPESFAVAGDGWRMVVSVRAGRSEVLRLGR